jgi:predicted Zn finger-like uncharacterized protein
VIVDCESCHTRFRLDESRIPATGAKVRCSRCKAAFVVQRPSATRDEVIEEVVAEASNPGTPHAPAPAEDLFEMTGSGVLSVGETEASVDPGASGEEKWEFDEAPSAAPRAGGTKSRSEPAAAPASGDADDLDALGSPEGWDLLGGAREIAAEARFEEPAPNRPVVQTPPRAVAPNPSEPARTLGVDSSLAAAVAEAPRADEAAGPAWLQTARSVAQYCIDSGVWVASVALCSLGLVLAISPPPDSPRAVIPASLLTASLRDQKFDVTRHSIESGVGGVLTVVRGQLPPAARTREPLRLRATWLDAQGEPIAGASAIAGPPLAQRELRELSLERLRAEQEARALELTAGGAFEAIFGALPDSARGIALQQDPVPVQAPVATQVQESAAEGATASSRPTAHPSSE